MVGKFGKWLEKVVATNHNTGMVAEYGMWQEDHICERDVVRGRDIRHTTVKYTRFATYLMLQENSKWQENMGSGRSL